MDFENMEIQYSPSKWSNRFRNSDEVISNHVSFATLETQKNMMKYKYKANICYGLMDRELFDIYYKDEEIGSPIFVYIHGGYWQELHKNISGYCVAPLVDYGYRVIIVDYNLCPEIELKEIIEQINRAIVKIFKYANETQANQLTFCGHSAGAHLIASTILNAPEKLDINNSNILTSIFLISGVYNLTDLWKTKSVNHDNILGLDEICAFKLSPIFNDMSRIKNIFKYLRIFVCVGGFESSVFKKQSENFYGKLLLADLKAKYHIFLAYDHFDIVENMNSDSSEITQYIKRNL